MDKKSVFTYCGLQRLEFLLTPKSGVVTIHKDKTRLDVKRKCVFPRVYACFPFHMILGIESDYFPKLC